MSNDELYYDSLTDLAERVARGLLNRSQPLSDLSQVMTQLAGTDTIKGQGADAMRAYIGEVHAPLNQAIQQAIENFRMACEQWGRPLCLCGSRRQPLNP
ncbi:T7SS effector LXG polymorphic toxin [Lactovum odontotermitis]